MFVRKKKNPSGVISVQVIDKSSGKYVVRKTVGSSSDVFKVVADSGLISNRNTEDLEERGYKYILGARIKNQPAKITEQICALKLKNGESKIIWKDKGTALVINYSDKRAKKDLFNRERGLKRL